MKDPQTTPAPSVPGQPPFTIKVLGVGGAGGNAVSHLATQPLSGVSFALLNTDSTALASSTVDTKVLLGERGSRGLGAGGDPERGRVAAEESLPAVQSLCAGADIVFVVAGLGGGTGTGAGPVIAKTAKESGALVLSIVMTPFDCEGARRQRQAQFGLHTLKQASDGVICLPNQKVFSLIDEKTSLVEAFRIINDLIAQGVRGIWRLLSKPGLINVDFADLCAVTQSKHGESALVTVEAKGDHRVREATDKLLAHPLVDNDQILARASGILLCIAGGPELSMADVERVMEKVRRNNDQAHIIMGTAIDPELADQIIVTLVASAPQDDLPTPATAAPPSAAPGASAPDSTPDPASDDPDASLESEGHERWTTPDAASKPPSRFVAPAPELSPEKAHELFLQSSGRGSVKKKSANRMRQGQLPLEIISKGRFEKSEPTLHRGEDLDVPTYIRRGVPLN